MRSGVCPKCSSRSVYAANGGLRYGSPGALVAHLEPGFKGIQPTHQPAGVWQFVCADCGYLESYALDDAAVAFVRQHWHAVQPGA